MANEQQNKQQISKALMNSPYYEAMSNPKANKGVSNAPQFYRPQGGMAMPQQQYYQQPKNAPVAATPIAKKKVKNKKKRKERDYFYVMRKGVCFLMMILILVVIAVFALGIIGILPQFTSLYKLPDNTPTDQRKEVETGEFDKNGKPILAYTAKEIYIGGLDPIFGALNEFFGIKDLGNSNFYDATSGLLENNISSADIMTTIAYYSFAFMPFALIFMIFMAIIVLFKCIFSFMGKRIYKRFGLCAILMLLGAVVTLIAGVAAISTLGAGKVGLDFGSVIPFLTGAFSQPPVTAPKTPLLPIVTGLGLLVFIAVPVVILLMSMFVKKRISYSIFDR